MTDISTTCAVENVLIVNNNSPIHDYVHRDHHTQPTGNYEMTQTFRKKKKKNQLKNQSWVLLQPHPLDDQGLRNVKC